MSVDPFLEQSTEALRRGFDACRSAVPDVALLAYAVYCDDTANSIAHIAASDRGAIEFTDGSSEDYVFNPEHWDVQAGLDQLGEVSVAIDELYRASEDYENDPDWHQRHRERVFELLGASLRALEGEGYFGTGNSRDEVFVIPWVMDSDVPRDRAADWSARLNPPGVHRRFVDWLATTDYWGPPGDRPPAKKAAAKKQAPRRR